MVGKAQTTAGTSYQPYSGGFTPDQQSAFSNIGGLAGSQNGTFAQANSATTNAMNPTYNSVGNYMTPYVQNVVNSTMANMNELNGQQQQQVVGNAISKGAMGGNRVGVAQGELARQQGLANNQTISGLWNDAYNNALGAAQNQQQVGLSAGQNLTNTANTQMNAGLAQAGAQLGAGTQQQQFNYQQYLNQQGYPYQQQSWLSSILGNSAVGGTTSTTAPYGNTFSSVLGAGLGIASLFKDGGEVPGRASGGVVPYKTNANAFMQGSSGWGGYVGDKSMPYAPDNSIYLPYIPTGDSGHATNDFPEAVDPLKDIEGAGADDPFSKYTGAASKKGASNIKGWVQSLFGPTYGGAEAAGYGSSYATGGVVPRQHLANGGVSDIYSGILMPQGGMYAPGPPVMMPSNGSFSGLGVVPSSGGRDGVGPGLSDPQSGMGGGWSQMEDFASQPTGSYPNANDVVRSIPGPQPSRGSGTIDGANPIDITRWGLTSDPFKTNQQPQARPSVAKPAAPLNNPQPWTPWGPDWGTGIGVNGTGASSQPPSLGSPGQFSTSDPFANDRFGDEGVVPRQGMVTGRAPVNIAIHGPSARPTVQANPSPVAHVANKPITYSTPVAAGNFAQGSPNQSFEKDHGMGSVTNSMASSSRWNTGYADGGKVSEATWEVSGLDGLMKMLKSAKLHWKGRDESANIEDHQPPMDTSHFGYGAPALPSDHFEPKQAFASGGQPKKKTANVSDLYEGILSPTGGLAGDAGALVPLTDPRATTDPNYAALSGHSGYGVVANDPFAAMPDVPAITPDDAGMNKPPVTTSPPPGLINPNNYGNTNNGVVPYSNGTSFNTQGDPRYSQNIGDAWSSLTQGHGLNLSPDVRQAMLAAGMGMMAGHSPGAFQNIGSGALAGVDTWFKRQELERENAKARADIGQTGQQVQVAAASGSAANAASRFTFVSTPYGMQVTDTFNPKQGASFVPWGNMLPDGTVAVPPSNGSGPPPLFSTEAPKVAVDPRMMSPDTRTLAVGESQMAITDARKAQQGASTANQQLLDLEHSLDTLPSTGWLSQGAGFEERLGLAKNINLAAQVAGLPPVLPIDAIAAGEDANKVSIRLGQNLASGLGSDPAAAIVMQSVSAVPGGYNSKAGAERIIGALKAANQRQIDYYTFVQKWQAQNGGSVLGADEYFNRTNPPELYALSAYVPKQALDYLTQHPDAAAAFNAKYGNGRDVARYVINR